MGEREREKEGERERDRGEREKITNKKIHGTLSCRTLLRRTE